MPRGRACCALTLRKSRSRHCPARGKAPNALPWRFMTVAEWGTREEFEASFYSPETQANLKVDVERISDAIFLVTEILTQTVNREESS